MPFKKGDQWQGNDKGRPVNSGHRQKLFNTLVEPYREKLFKTAINLALSGNESMLRLFLERMLPAKPVDNDIQLNFQQDNFRKAEMLIAAGESVVQSVHQGDLTPMQGNSLMSLIEAQRKNIETSDLALRLAEINRTLKQRK